MKTLPRFLYHFTSIENMQKILKQGIKASENIWDGSVRDASVYMVDAQNLAKNWTKPMSAGYGLHSCLIFGQALRDGARELCCFRIPTNKLTSSVTVRSQKYCFDKNSILPGAEILSKANKYKLYQRNGHSIEYIHSGDISPTLIEFVGRAKVPSNIGDFFEVSPTELNESATSMLKEIFKKGNEIKSFT